jgi:hypothetical protein
MSAGAGRTGATVPARLGGPRPRATGRMRQREARSVVREPVLPPVVEDS